MATRFEQRLNDILLAALRKVNAYGEGTLPSVEILENARQTFNNLIDSLENKGVRIFRKVWRTRVFEPSSTVMGTDSKCYRCIRYNVSPNAVTWTPTTIFQVGDLVFPTTRNGFYYKVTTAGTTGGVEPTFPENQEDTIVDGTVTWITRLDTRPVDGRNWKRYWELVEDLETTPPAYAQNTTYTQSGEFFLSEDEISIERAFIRYVNNDTAVDIIRLSQYTDIDLKNERSYPYYLSVEYFDKYTQLAHLYPEPEQTGAEGYVLHYLANLRSENQETDGDIDFPDNWFRALTLMLAYDLSVEFNVDYRTKVVLRQDAEKAMKDVMAKDSPRVTSRGIQSPWSERYRGINDYYPNSNYGCSRRVY